MKRTRYVKLRLTLDQARALHSAADQMSDDYVWAVDNKDYSLCSRKNLKDFTAAMSKLINGIHEARENNNP